MERCAAHRREHAGACNWCGSKLCHECISHKQGSLVYCEKCNVRLSVAGKARVEAVPTAQVRSAPRKISMTKDGYADLT